MHAYATAVNTLRSYRSRFGAQQTPAALRELILKKLRHVTGNIMWDVGAGSGAIAIEWKLSRPHAQVYAIEQYQERCEDIACNAHHHGAEIDILHQEMYRIPEALPAPDMIWLGCPGESADDLSALLWEYLLPAGWIASNAVSPSGVTRLQAAQRRFGGSIEVHDEFDLPRVQWIAQKI